MNEILASMCLFLWLMLLVDALKLGNTEPKHARHEVAAALLSAIVGCFFVYRAVMANATPTWEILSTIMSIVMIVPLMLIALVASILVWVRVGKS